LQNLNWRSINNILDTLSEAQVLEMLNEERGNRRRVTILVRLHQRYSALRTARERIEILNEAKAP
jgi:predicted transcriptional regulator